MDWGGGERERERGCNSMKNKSEHKIYKCRINDIEIKNYFVQNNDKIQTGKE